jgi:rhodanese-related sulfurtransferase
MAKKHRGGGHSAQKPARSTSSRPATPKATAPRAVAVSSPGRVDRRIMAAVAGIVVVVVLGGFLAVGTGLGGSSPTPTPAPTAVALAAIPAPDIEPAEAAQRWAEGALLLDVREQDEWDAGHIPGTTHIPLSVLQTRIGELPDDQTILVICRSGNRSQQARDLILAAGLSNVTSVNGGVRGWQAAGFGFDGSILG